MPETDVLNYMREGYQNSQKVRVYALIEICRRIVLVPALKRKIGEDKVRSVNTALDCETRGEGPALDCDSVYSLAAGTGLGLDEILPLSDEALSKRDPVISLTAVESLFRRDVCEIF